MVLFNADDTLGQLITLFTNNVTGSLFLTFVVITMFFVVIGFLFKLPLEFALIIDIPLLIVFLSYDTNYFQVGGTALILLAVYLTKTFFIKD